MAVKKPLPPLSETHLEIMNVIWDRKEATVAEVWAAVSARRPVARNTVLTLMTRLAAKGWLRHRPDGNTFRYAAAVPRQSAVGGMVSRLVDTAFAGSTENLVMALLDSRGVSSEEAARIRDRIAREGDERRVKS
ncbi:MAG: BlaI/MecI/CopY family transcriptional regulator [Planctomycetota bacterium]